MIRTYFKRDVISQLQFFTLISFPRPSKKTRFLLVLSFPIIFDRLLLLWCGYFFLKLIGPNFLLRLSKEVAEVCISHMAWWMSLYLGVIFISKTRMCHPIKVSFFNLQKCPSSCLLEDRF